MIAGLNLAVDDVELHLATDASAPVDAAGIAVRMGTTEHHLRRMFSSLAGMPLSDYVRRRRMSLAAADRGEYRRRPSHGRRPVRLRLDRGVRAGIRSVHGTDPGDVRRKGGPLRTQPRIRFHLTVEGSVPMDTRITTLPAVRLVGHAKRVPLIHEGINPHIAEHVASIPVAEIVRLKNVNDTEPTGVLSVSDDLDPDRAEGSELTYMQGVATTAPPPEGLDVIDVPAGTWAVFRTEGTHPVVLQEAWAATTTTWFPSQPWRLRPGPEILAMLAFDADAATATCEPLAPCRGSVAEG